MDVNKKEKVIMIKNLEPNMIDDEVMKEHEK